MPEGSMLFRYFPADHIDAYSCAAPFPGEVSPDDLQVAFWADPPGWVKALFKLRDILVSPFGLENGSGGDMEKFAECIRSGGSLGVASIAGKSAEETIVLLNDSHLDAYMSICLSPGPEGVKTVTATTLVHFHNRLGRAYFFLIGPFHKVIVKMMLKRSVKNASAI